MQWLLRSLASEAKCTNNGFTVNPTDKNCITYDFDCVGTFAIFKKIISELLEKYFIPGLIFDFECNDENAHIDNFRAKLIIRTVPDMRSNILQTLELANTVIFIEGGNYWFGREITIEPRVDTLRDERIALHAFYKKHFGKNWENQYIPKAIEELRNYGYGIIDLKVWSPFKCTLRFSSNVNFHRAVHHFKQEVENNLAYKFFSAIYKNEKSNVITIEAAPASESKDKVIAYCKQKPKYPPNPTQVI